MLQFVLILQLKQVPQLALIFKQQLLLFDVLA